MCGKFGDDEIESMRNMMSLAVYSVLADIFDVNMSEISPNSDLENDLRMTASIREQLDEKIKEMFDNFHVDFSKAKNVQDIVDQIIENKMMSVME